MKTATEKQEDNQEVSLEKGTLPLVQDHEDKVRVTTVVPDNDNGKPGAPANDPANNKKQEEAMLQFMTGLPPHVVGIHAAGEVTKEDYQKVIVLRIDELAKRQGDINFLFVLDTDVTSLTAAAWWEDFKLGLKHFTHWKRVAIVTDQKGLEWFADLSNFFIPGKAKGFELNELEKAKQWVSRKDGHHDHDFVEPPSDNDELEPEVENSSNKGQGPAGENL